MLEFDVGEVECHAWGIMVCRLGNVDEEKGTEGDGGCYCCLPYVNVCQRSKGMLAFSWTTACSPKRMTFPGAETRNDFLLSNKLVILNASWLV